MVLKTDSRMPLLLQLSIITILICTLLVVLFPVRTRISAYITDQKQLAIEYLEKKIKHNISYDSIAPSILHAFEIRGFRISSEENPEEYIFEVEKLRLRFNLFNFRLSNPLNAFEGLLIVNSKIEYDSSKNLELINVAESLLSPGKNSGTSETGRTEQLLPPDFTIRGRNLSVSVKTEQFSLELSKIFLTLGTSSEGDLVFAVKTDTSAKLLSLPSTMPLDSFELKSDMSISGRMDTAFNWADLDIQMKKLQTDVFSINRIKFNFRYEKPGKLVVTKTGDSIPADMILTANFTDGLYNAELVTQDFVFSRYFDTYGFPDNYKLVTDAVISGRASASINSKLNEFMYSGNLSVGNITGLTEKPAGIEAVFSGTNRKLDIENSKFFCDLGNASFQGQILIEKLPEINGKLTVPGISYNGMKLSSTLVVKTEKNGKYKITSDNTEFNGIVLSALDLELLPYEENMEYSLNTDILNPDLTPEHIYSEGIIQFGKEIYLQLVFSAESLLLKPVIEALPLNIVIPEILNGLELSSEIYLSGTAEQLSFASPFIRINDRYNDKRSLTFSISGNNSGFRLSDLNLVWDENRLSGRISTDLTETNTLVLQSSLNLNKTPINLSGVLDTDGSLALYGDYDIKLNWYSIPGGGNSILFNTKRLPIVSAAGETAFLSINATGIFNSIDQWKLFLKNLEVEDIKTGFGPGNLKLSALLGENGGNIYNIHYSDSGSELNGKGSLLLTGILPRPEGRLQLYAKSPSSAEEYNLMIGFINENLDGYLNFNSFPLSRISEDFPLKGDVFGSFSIAGTVASPQMRVQLNTGNTFFNSEKLSMETVLSYENLKLKLEQLSAVYGAYQISDVDGLLDLENGFHQLSARLTSESKLLGLNAALYGEAETVKIDSFFKLPEIFKSDLNADLAFEKLFLNLEAKDPWKFRIVKRDKLLNITGGTQGEISGNYFQDGYFTLDAVTPFPVTISASGTIKNGLINAAVKDIKYTFDNLEIPFFYFYGGEINGNLRIQGPLNDPDFYGQLDCSNMVFRPPIIQDITEPFDTSFFLSGKTLDLPATMTDTNNGKISINLTANMERWLPRIYDININVPVNDSVSAEFYKKPIYIRGFCTGQIHIYGDLTRMNVDGHINGTEAVFMVNYDLDIKSIGSPTEFTSGEMHFSFGENNQFFWPSQEFPIVKGFLSGASDLTMRYDTSGIGVVLDGDLILNGGEIFYFKKNFYIKEGEIIFNNNTARNLDPLLSTRAEIRDINSEGEMSKIYLIVDQSPLSAFSPRFESEPSMSTAEIMAILGGNILDTFESGDSSIRNAVLLGTDLFTQFAVLKGIEENLKNTLGLDLLSIRSSFLSNLLANTLLSNSDDLNGDNFSKYLDNTTLFLGKYFTDDIFLQGMFQFDLYNDTGYSENPELNFDSEIKLEWESPIADVELSFYPDFQDPVAGLNRTSVGLSWRFSY